MTAEWFLIAAAYAGMLLNNSFVACVLVILAIIVLFASYPGAFLLHSQEGLYFRKNEERVGQKLREFGFNWDPPFQLELPLQ